MTTEYKYLCNGFVCVLFAPGKVEGRPMSKILNIRHSFFQLCMSDIIILTCVPRRVGAANSDRSSPKLHLRHNNLLTVAEGQVAAPQIVGVR